MQLKTRLTIIFTLITGIILLICSFTIYILSSRYRKTEFEERLKKKLHATARLYADIDEVDARLLRIIQQQELGILPNEQILVLSLEGDELYRSDEVRYFEVSDEFIRDIKNNGEYSDQIGMFEVFGKIYNGKSGTYISIAGGYDKFGFSKLRNLRYVLIFVTLGGLIVLFLSGWFYSVKALKPIDHLIRQANEMNPDNLSVRLSTGENHDELTQIAVTLNSLFDRIESAFKAQKAFVANASHELRTPLTLIGGQLEVLLMKDRSIAEYKATSESILEDIHRLNTISNRLLLLAQTEKSPEQLPISSVRIDEVLWSVKAELQRNKLGYVVQVNFENTPSEEEWMVIKGNQQLLETAFINLSDNACKFSANHQCVIVTKFSKEKVTIVFSDSGIGIPDEEIALLFQPFYRSSTALTFHGHGLGLSMVKKIIDLHKGSIKVESRLGEGTKFIIELFH